MAYRIIMSIMIFCFIPGMIKAKERKDSTYLLQEVLVTAQQPNRDIIPVQTLSGDELHRLNSNSVADALRYFSGVQLKDYGGVVESRLSISALWAPII